MKAQHCCSLPLIVNVDQIVILRAVECFHYCQVDGRLSALGWMAECILMPPSALLWFKCTPRGQVHSFAMRVRVRVRVRSHLELGVHYLLINKSLAECSFRDCPGTFNIHSSTIWRVVDANRWCTSANHKYGHSFTDECRNTYKSNHPPVRWTWKQWVILSKPHPGGNSSCKVFYAQCHIYTYYS